MAVMLARGDRFPDLTLTRLDGSTFAYATLWQRRHLLLVALPPGNQPPTEAEVRYLDSLAAHEADLEWFEVTRVVTRDVVAGLPAPGVAIVDRWGRVVSAESGRQIAAMPTADALMGVVRMIGTACSW